MPLDGTLKGLSLPNLVQLQCTEQKRALVNLKRRAAEGLLVFVDGELIYASVGSLTGENAVYALIIWDDAAFHVSNDVAVLPERNVNTPWQTLVLEGLRRADEINIERAQDYAQMASGLSKVNAVTEWHLCTVDGAEFNSAGEEVQSPLADWVANSLQEQVRLGASMNLGNLTGMVFSNPKQKWVLVPYRQYWVAALMNTNAALSLVRDAIARVAQK
jgi:hypothetical protein